MADTVTCPVTGNVYHLGKLPPDPLKRAAFKDFTDVKPVPLPRDQWRKINNRSVFGADFMLDQKQHGSCVGFSAAHALMRIRSMQGFTHVRLSGAYIYSKINGGRDNGAIISDALQELLANGTCTEAEAGWDQIYPSEYNASANETAKRFVVLEAYQANAFDDLVTGLHDGFIAVGAVMVGGSFMSLDGNGVAGWDAGPGNHAVCFDGVNRLPNGEWVLDLPNSWGASFGVGGRCYVTQKHIETVEQDAYLLRAAKVDPQDVQPPAVKGAGDGQRDGESAAA